MRSLIWIGVIFAVLGGCTWHTERRVQQQNERLAEKLEPVRMDYKGNPFTGSTITRVWAGTPGTSTLETADATLREDVWASFRQACGYEREDRKQVRIVRHDPPLAYEVWVFQDPDSNRVDNTVGLSLILRSTPERGGTDIRIKGDCPD